MILVALALQAAAQAQPATSPAAIPQRFSILQPHCEPSGDPDDIIVCSRGPDGQRLPLPDERAPPNGAGANRERTGVGALALQSTPCAATQWGCTVGFGPPIMPIVAGAVSAVKSAFAKHPDKSNRVAIPLDDPAAATAGH